MGIPRLASHLRPFARRTVLEGDHVIIDGPAFAFHILHLCLANTRANGPFDWPSYALLGETALAWLDYLQASGITV